MADPAARESRESMGVPYAVARAIGRFWIWFLFKAVDVRYRERVPATGPVLLCINHPNNLIDSLLVAAVLRREVHFLATAALFRNPLVARFLLACGAIPVYRKQDEPVAREAGRGGRGAQRGRLLRLLSHPERGRAHRHLSGGDHPRRAARPAHQDRRGADRARIRGAARAGRRAGRRAAGAGPLGLTFEARKSFRARVLVSFGEPIARRRLRRAVSPRTPARRWTRSPRPSSARWRPRWSTCAGWTPPRSSARWRTSTGASSCASCRRSAGSPAARSTPSGSRAPSPRPPRTSRSASPSAWRRLWQRIQAYRALLPTTACGTRRCARVWRAAGSAPRFGRGSRASLAFPFFLYGVVVNGLPYFLPRWLARRFARKETDYATTRFLSSIVAIPLVLGPRDLAGVAAGRTRLGGPLRGVPSAERAPRLPLSRRRSGGCAASSASGRWPWRGASPPPGCWTRARTIIAELERAKNDYLAATQGSTF